MRRCSSESLLARCSLFIAHLYWKFAIRGFDHWWASLQGSGYPTVVLLYVLCVEFAGALLLIPGIFTRWVSLFTLSGFFFADAGAELPTLWGLALIVQALLGNGAYAARVPHFCGEQSRASEPV
jgi:putative oxidoreductase